MGPQIRMRRPGEIYEGSSGAPVQCEVTGGLFISVSNDTRETPSQYTSGHSMAPSSLNQTELYAQTARLSFSSYEDPLRFMVVLIKRKQEFLLIVMYFCFDT